eukprot:Sro303_g112350.1 n/a (432) ;mRNA; f:4020-5315
MMMLVNALPKQGLISVNEYSCDSTKTIIDSRILFLHFLEDDDSSVELQLQLQLLLDDDNLVAILEETILESYNNQSFVSCDLPHFRTMQSVTLIQDTDSMFANTEQYYDYYYDSQGRSTIVLAFQVQAHCRNCTDTQPLFEEYVATANNSSTTTVGQATATTKATPASPPKLTFSTTRQVPLATLDDGSCVCPISARPQPNLLAQEEFLPVLNTNIRLSTGFPLINAFSLAELQSIDCGDSEDMQTFTSSSYVSVEMRIGESPSDSELKKLQTVFMNTYNELAFQSCDPNVRTISEVSLQIQFEKDSEQEQHDMATAVFSIEGQCQNNCPVTKSGSLSLFEANSSGFQLPTRSLHQRKLSTRTNNQKQFEWDVVKQHRHLQDSCLCPANSNPKNGVSEGEFLQSFQQEIDRLQEEGEIEAIEHAVDLQEALL